MCPLVAYRHTTSMPVDLVSPLEAHRFVPPSHFYEKKVRDLETTIARLQARLTDYIPGDGFYERTEDQIAAYQVYLQREHDMAARAQEDLPTYLRMARHEARLTQDQLGTLANISPSVISRQELGRYGPRDGAGVPERLVAVCAYCIATPKDQWPAVVPRIPTKNARINNVPLPRQR